MAYLYNHHITCSLGDSSQHVFDSMLNGNHGFREVKESGGGDPFCFAPIDDRIKALLGENKLAQLMIRSIEKTISTEQKSLEGDKNLLIISTTKGNIQSLVKSKGKSINEASLGKLKQSILDSFHVFKDGLLISNACASGTYALVIAQRYIDSGEYDNVVICGGDLISPFTLSGFQSFHALSSKPCKPFDSNRVGLNLGEAIATVWLGKEKKSNSGFQLIGGASTDDANHISGPSRTGEGVYLGIEKTLKYCNRSLEDVDYISAHGTATNYNDEMEAIALDRHGLNDVSVNSLKGYFGHTLGAAGIIETIIAVKQLEHNVVLATKGFEELGVSKSLNLSNKNIEVELNSFIKTSSGFGGTNAVLYLEKYG